MARFLALLTLLKLQFLVLIGRTPRTTLLSFRISALQSELSTLGYHHAAQSLQDSLTYITAHDLRMEA